MSKASISRFLAVVLALTLVGAACSDNDESDGSSNTSTTRNGDESTVTTTDNAEVTLGGTLHVGLEAETNSWKPGEGSFSNPGVMVALAIYDPIAYRGADGDIHPYLAESIEPNDDLTEWTINLRENVKFHDGTALTAEVMKTIFDEFLSAPGSNLSNAAQVDEVRVDDTLTYTYVLHQGSAAFPDLLAGAMGWPFSPEACRAAGDNCGSQPVGTGPFKLQSWARDADLVVVKNDDYWRTDENGVQLPYLDKVVFRALPDEDSRLQSVRAGDVQLGQSLRQGPIRQALAAEEAGELKVYFTVGNSSGSSIINTAVPPTNDVRIRRALAFALDQDALVAILDGTGISPPQTQYFSSESPWYSEKVAAAWPTNQPDKARELLDEYVNDPERSDGKAAGTPVEIDFMCPPDPTLIQVAQGYQQLWTDVGFEVTLEQVDNPTQISRAVGSADTDPPYVGNYMITCWRNGGESDPYTTLYTQFSDPAITPGNVTNYHSDYVDEQLEILRSNADFNVRYEAVENIMMDFAENVPNTWTGATANALYSTNKVHNVAGWTLPGGIEGRGAAGAVTFVSQIWMDK